MKNTGRLGELLVPEAKVTLQRARNPERKTIYDLISVYKLGLEWVNTNSIVPNELMKHLNERALQILYYICRVEAERIGNTEEQQ